MNRLYAIESMPTSTGARADHRLPLKPSDIGHAWRRRIAGAIGAADAGPAVDSGRTAKWVAAVAKDLQAHRGASLVLAGDAQPPIVHALAHAMNQALGNVGKTVVYTNSVEAEPIDQLASLRNLVADMDAGAVDLLVIVERQSGLHRAGRSRVRRRDEQGRSSACTSVCTTMRRRRCAIGTFQSRTFWNPGATRAATTAPRRSSSR